MGSGCRGGGGAGSVGSTEITDLSITGGDIAENTINPSKIYSSSNDAALYLRGDKTWANFAADVLNVPLSTYALDATTKPTVLVTDRIGPALGKVQKFLNDLNTDYMSKTALTQTVTGTFSFTSPTSFLYTQLPTGASPNEAANVQYVQNYVTSAVSGIGGAYAPGILTTASAATSGDTTLTVASTTGYPAAGTLLVGSEAIIYTGKTATTFTGLTRGAFGTTAATITGGATVNNYVLMGKSTDTVTSKMVVTGSGNVGIGTSNPVGILDAQGGTAAAATTGSPININAQNGGAGGAAGGDINLTPGTGSWGSGRVYITGVNTRPVLQVNRHGGIVYSSSSSSEFTPTTNSYFANGYSTTGNSALHGFGVRNGTSEDQEAYFGAVSIAGVGNMSPALVWGQRTGATSYVERMRIDSSGNVGIGTATPATKLDVAGVVNATTLAGNIWTNSIMPYSAGSPMEIQGGNNLGWAGDFLKLGRNTYTSTSGTLNAVTIVPIYNQASGTASNTDLLINRTETAVGSGAQNLLDAQVNGSSRFIIKNSGNVGIGTTTPNRPLYIADLVNGISYELKIDNYSSSASAASGILFSTGGGGASNFDMTRGKGGLIYTYKSSWNRGDFHFLQNSALDSTNPSLANSVMVIKNSGEVGIGTDVPFSLLSNTSANSQDQSSKGTWSTSSLTWSHANNAYAGSISNTGTGADMNGLLVKIAETASTAKAFTVNVAGLDKLTVNGSGNVGIGTSTPTSKLEVLGNIEGMTVGTSLINVGGRWSASQDQIESLATYPLNFGTSTSGAPQTRMTITTSGDVGIGLTNPTYQLQLSTDSAAKPGTSTWTIASDERLKDIRAPFTRGLKELNGLHTVYFNYKESNPLDLPFDKEYVGIKAQDVLKVIPEAVSKDDKGFLHVTNDSIIWTAINAIKELFNKLIGLDSRVQKLAAENAQLKIRADKMEKENLEIKARLIRLEKNLTKN